MDFSKNRIFTLKKLFTGQSENPVGIARIYTVSLHNPNIKRGIFPTPLGCIPNALIFASDDSATSVPKVFHSAVHSGQLILVNGLIKKRKNKLLPKPSRRFRFFLFSSLVRCFFITSPYHLRITSVSPSFLLRSKIE